jgi:hypothetical protein
MNGRYKGSYIRNRRLLYMATRLLHMVTKENQRFLLVYKVINDYSFHYFTL